jgi:hypothetical protein
MWPTSFTDSAKSSGGERGRSPAIVGIAIKFRLDVDVTLWFS